MPTRRTVIATAGTAALVAGLPGAGWAEGAAPIATTKHGRVRGAVDQGIKVFKGVRYGADTSTRRFQPAVAPEAWTEVRDALEYGAASPQKSEEPNQSEDCLFLNVWTPELRDGGKRPVMVYVHGGAHANGSGSSPLYDGVALCKRGDVVVVTLNHRLNVFGYNGLGQLLSPHGGAPMGPRAASATSTCCWPCAGCGTISPSSAATPAMSWSSASRAAGPSW